MEVNIPIVRKIVRKAVVASMAIAKNNKLGFVVKRDSLGFLISPGKPFLGRHKRNFV
tara:strand:+ start:12 stop:182 length:171 start_codon:yes stop_codon:yes gene_type:complete